MILLSKFPFTLPIAACRNISEPIEKYYRYDEDICTHQHEGYLVSSIRTPRKTRESDLQIQTDTGPGNLHCT